MAIITISKEFASGGQYIALRVAELLNIDYFDREILKEVASKASVSEMEVEGFEEDRHSAMKVFFSRIIDPIIMKENLKESMPLLPKEPEEPKKKQRFKPYTCEVKGWIDGDIYKEMVEAFIKELAKKETR